jgi:hypothetical protein
MSYITEIGTHFDPMIDGQELGLQWTAHQSLGATAASTELTTDRPVDVHEPVAKDGIEVYAVAAEEFARGIRPAKRWPGSRGLVVEYTLRPATA